MEFLTTMATEFGVSFLLLVIHPELQKLASAVRQAFKFFFKKPFESFMVLSLCIILAGVIKLAFLQG